MTTAHSGRAEGGSGLQGPPGERSAGRPSTPHPGAALRPRPHAHAGRECADDTRGARIECRRPPPRRGAGRPRRDPLPPPSHRPASRGGPGPHPRGRGDGPPLPERGAGARPAPPPQPPAPTGAAENKRAHANAPGRRTDRAQRRRASTNRSGMGATPPMDSTTPVTPALLPAQGRQRDGTRQSDPPALQAPRPHKRGVRRTPPPPQPAPRHTNATDPPRGAQPPQGVQAEGTEKGPHTRTPAPTTRGSRTPTARPVGGQSGEGERLTPDAPRNSKRHPPRGRPTATPITPSQVGGNRDRTAPPPSTPDGARDRGRTRGGERTTWNQRPVPGPREVCMPHHPGGGSEAARARAHTHVKGTRGLPEGQPYRARGTHRPRRMAYQRARVRDTGTGRPATRSAGHAGRERGNERDTTPGTGPNPPNRPRAPRTHRRGTAPAKAVVAHSATPQPLGWAASAPAQGGPTGDKPVARARRRRRPGDHALGGRRSG